MLDCTTDKYDDLYARWLEKPGDLLDLAGYKPVMYLLDLCGGTGVVTREAIRRGSEPQNITLWDKNPRLPLPGVLQIAGDAKHLPGPLHGPYDVVVCRQAVAYLDVTPVFAGVRQLLKTGGVFVFNSFVRPKWAWKSYTYDGARFIEASGWIGKWVLHLQWCRGGGFDVSLFQWHREEELRGALVGFDVEVTRSERGLRWRCTKV